MSSIYLGNLSIYEFLKRTGYNMSDEDRHILETHRQDRVDIDPNSDKFHIYDIPFCINVSESYKDELLRILRKYDNISPSKTMLSISIAAETETDKALRIKREREKAEYQQRLENPNSIWNVKWHMLVPITVTNGKEAYYSCFINTYTTGRDNIPDIIDGYANIRMDEIGFHGTYKLFDQTTVDDANLLPDICFVVGSGFFRKSGAYIGQLDGVYFNDTNFSIKEAINNYVNMNGDAKEISFSRIK